MPQLDLSERTVEGHPAIAVSGQLTILTAPDLRRLLMKHVRRDEPALLLDLSGLSFMDTSGLATLIETQLKVEEHGGRLVLFGLQPLIAEVFDVTRVTKLFSIHESESDAVLALDSPDD